MRLGSNSPRVQVPWICPASPNEYVPISRGLCYSLTHLSIFSIPLAPLGWVQGIDFAGTNQFRLEPRHSQSWRRPRYATHLATRKYSRRSKNYLQMAKKRIQKEILDLGKENLGDMKLEPSDSSIFEWMGSIPGPVGSIYEGGVFNVKITLPNDYP